MRPGIIIIIFLSETFRNSAKANAKPRVFFLCVCPFACYATFGVGSSRETGGGPSSEVARRGLGVMMQPRAPWKSSSRRMISVRRR